MTIWVNRLHIPNGQRSSFAATFRIVPSSQQGILRDQTLLDDLAILKIFRVEAKCPNGVLLLMKTITWPGLPVIGSVQNGPEVIPLGAACVFLEVVLGRDRGNLLGDGRGDELFDADPFLLRHLVDMAMDGFG
jgi:hypothetical protein